MLDVGTELLGKGVHKQELVRKSRLRCDDMEKSSNISLRPYYFTDKHYPVTNVKWIATDLAPFAAVGSGQGSLLVQLSVFRTRIETMGRESESDKRANKDSPYLFQQSLWWKGCG